MLVNKIEQISEAHGWRFNYGKGHWQNLLDLPDDSDLNFDKRQKYFLMHYQNREINFNDYGRKGIIYESEALLCVRSRMNDEDYNFKYKHNIRRLRGDIDNVLIPALNCDKFNILSFKDFEIENALDTNVDGILIRFKLQYAK